MSCSAPAVVAVQRLPRSQSTYVGETQWLPEPSSGSTTTRASASLPRTRAARTSSSITPASTPTASSRWLRARRSPSTPRPATRAPRPSTSPRCRGAASSIERPSAPGSSERGGPSRFAPCASEGGACVSCAVGACAAGLPSGAPTAARGSIAAGRSPASRPARAYAFSAAGAAAANAGSVHALRRGSRYKRAGVFVVSGGMPGRLNGGNIMTSTIDAAPAVARAVAHTTADEADAKATTAARRAGGERMKIRVVVAEDHPLVREGVIRALERDPGMQVIGEADNGITAMELARELKPDVMVLDLRMPGLGGAVVLERLRAELPEIRALVMTANESPESLLDAVAAGAAGYLSKRTTGEELRQAVITTYGGGSVITPELAGHLLREFSGSARGEGSSVRPLLAARELEILRLVADGLTDNEIGKQLYISPRTVQNHLTRIREKTGLRRRSELARWAVEHAIA